MFIPVPVPIIRRKFIIRRFLKAGAVDFCHAVNPLDIQVQPRFLFSRLVSKGTIVDAGNGKYYIDTTKI